MLEDGADPNAVDREKSTPLHATATGIAGSTDGSAAKVAQVLIAHGANLSAKDHKGRTPLDIAVEEGRKQVVMTLAKHGAATSDRLSLAAAVGDNTGLAGMLGRSSVSPPAAAKALTAVARNGNAAAVKLLIPRVGNIDLLPALKAAIYSGNHDAFLLIYPLAHNANPQDLLVRAAGLGDVNTAEFLLGHGAKLNAPANDPELQAGTPLSEAIMWQSLPMVRFLLSKGASTGFIQRWNFPIALAFIAGGKDPEKIALELLGHGAEANPVIGEEPELRDMVTNPEPGEIRFVADHCTNINATTNYGATALDAAHDPETIRILLEHGARPGPGLSQGPSFLDRIRTLLSRLLHP